MIVSPKGSPPDPLNYIEKIAKKIAAKCGAKMTGNDGHLCRNYALLCLVLGGDTTSENVHDAWSAWAAEHSPGHKSLVPFSRLSEEVQALDDKYRDAILAVADEVDGYHD